MRAELVSMLAGVRLARPGLAKKLVGGVETVAGAAAAVGGGVGGGGGVGVERGGVAVKEFVIRCKMTGPQAKVYAAVVR